MRRALLITSSIVLLGLAAIGAAIAVPLFPVFAAVTDGTNTISIQDLRNLDSGCASVTEDDKE